MSNPTETIEIEPGDIAAEQTPIVPLPDPEPAPSGENTTQEKPAEILAPSETVHEIDAHISSASKAYVAFDPTIHAANADGTPKFKQDGTYALKRGRKSGAVNVPRETPQALPTAENAPQATAGAISNAVAETAAKVNYSEVGKMWAGMFFGMTNSLIGPEWAPANTDEKKAVETAFANWAKSSGNVDLPPGWALVATLGFYSAARLQHENTSSKFKKLRDKMRHVVLWVKNKVSK